MSLGSAQVALLEASSGGGLAHPYGDVHLWPDAGWPEEAAGNGRHGLGMVRYRNGDVRGSCDDAGRRVEALPAGPGQVDLGPGVRRTIPHVGVRQVVAGHKTAGEAEMAAAFREERRKI